MDLGFKIWELYDTHTVSCSLNYHVSNLALFKEKPF